MTAIRRDADIHDTHTPERVAEKLILEGYRRWCAWIVTRDDFHWEVTKRHFVSALGNRDGSYALGLFAEFATRLKLSTQRSLFSRPCNCESLCFQEVLLLGLLSGIQHDDGTAVALCLDGITGNSNHDELYPASEALAQFLYASEKEFFPIPANTIKSVITETISTNTIQ
ncbi:MAG: hypothetical protein AAF217_06565 [Pseudomonadota bacterium]